MTALLHTFGRIAALFVLLSLVVRPAPLPAEPAMPIITPTSWSDSFEDSKGLSWLDRARGDEGQIALSRAQELGQDMLEAISMAQGADGRFYLGGDNAHLWVYDDATGQSLDLGGPVPVECET